MFWTERERERASMRHQRKQFEKLRASELYCPRCRVAQPVRERLLLVLPRSEIHEYRCVACGSSLATREERDLESVKIVR